MSPTEVLTFGADETPADVDVAVVAVALLGVEMVRANDGGVGDHLASCRHAQVACMVRHGAPEAAHQPACGGGGTESFKVSRGSQKPSVVRRLTFSGSELGAGVVVAAEAGVQRAAEALVVECGKWVVADAGLVVELTAVRHVTAAHLPLQLLTDEAFMSSCRKKTHL